MKKSIIATLFFLLAACIGGKPSPVAQPGALYTVFLAGIHSGNGKANKLAQLKKVVVAVEPGVEVMVYDAFTANAVYRFKIPTGQLSEDKRGEYYDEIIQDAVAERLVPTNTPVTLNSTVQTPASTDSSANTLNLPAITRRLLDIRQENPGTKIKAVLLGSPYFAFPGAELPKTALPDSFLCENDSPLRIVDGHPLLKNMDIHFFFNDAPELSANACKFANVRRFVNLYFGGHLLTFSNDLNDLHRLVAVGLAPLADKLDCQHPVTPTCGSYQLEKPKKKVVSAKTTPVRKASSFKKAAPKTSNDECIGKPQRGAN